jgi:hypothetical protein
VVGGESSERMSQPAHEAKGSAVARPA